MVKKIWLGSLLALIILTTSFYILMPEKVRIDFTKTRTVFRVYEEGKFVISGIEYTRIFDGTKLMRAKNRTIDSIIIGSETYAERVSQFKEGIIAVDSYLFNNNVTNVETVPISHKVCFGNAKDKIFEYLISNIEYNGTTRDIMSQFDFGKNMKITFQDGYYRAKVYNYKYASDKIKIRYRITKDYECFDIRLFDPVWHGINISKIKGNCVNNTEPTFGNITYNYTCPTGSFNSTRNPNYAWCWQEELNSSGNYNLLFEGRFDRWNKPTKTLWWDIWQVNGTETVETCEIIGYKVKNKRIMFETFPFRCWLEAERKCVKCKSTIDGDGKPPFKSGDGTSWCKACIVNGSIVNTCKDDADFLRGFSLK